MAAQQQNGDDYDNATAVTAQLSSQEAALKAEVDQLPHEITEFLLSWGKAAYFRDSDALRRLYEGDFNHLTSQFYNNTRWPSVPVVDYCFRTQGGSHKLLLCLYQEMYYRHLFSHCAQQVSPADRDASWQNYEELMKYFIREECAITVENQNEGLQLPSEWLWDMVDEFVFQFQEAQLWREKAESEAERIARREMPFWNSPDVLDMLTALVEESGIGTFLTKTPELQGALTQYPIRYQLGYFATICLLRINVLMGSYRAGLNSISLIKFSQSSFFWRVPACTVTLFYLTGFSYMMLRRYEDAVRTFSHILLFIGKARSYLLSQSYQRDAMAKMADRMALLVLLCGGLGTVRLDDALVAQLRDVSPDKYFKVQSTSDVEVYREMFLKACPKSISAASYEAIPRPEKLGTDLSSLNSPTPIDDSLIGNRLDTPNGQTFSVSLLRNPKIRQLNAFLQDVKCQQKVVAVRSLARLYNNIDMVKLAILMEIPEDENAQKLVRADVMSAKHHTRQVVWKGGPPISGESTRAVTGVDFYVDNDLVYVQSIDSRTDFVGYFIKEIAAIEEMVNQLGPI